MSRPDIRPVRNSPKRKSMKPKNRKRQEDQTSKADSLSKNSPDGFPPKIISQDVVAENRSEHDSSTDSVIRTYICNESDLEEKKSQASNATNIDDHNIEVDAMNTVDHTIYVDDMNTSDHIIDTNPMNTVDHVDTLSHTGSINNHNMNADTMNIIDHHKDTHTGNPVKNIIDRFNRINNASVHRSNTIQPEEGKDFIRDHVKNMIHFFERLAGQETAELSQAPDRECFLGVSVMRTLSVFEGALGQESKAMGSSFVPEVRFSFDFEHMRGCFLAWFGNLDEVESSELFKEDLGVKVNWLRADYERKLRSVAGDAGLYENQEAERKAVE